MKNSKLNDLNMVIIQLVNCILMMCISVLHWKIQSLEKEMGNSNKVAGATIPSGKYKSSY